MNVMNILILAFLFVIGTVVGSFTCCQAWRWCYRIEKKKNPGKWSACMSCGYRLKWYDKIPVLSWLMLRGKCRKCHKKIGVAELLMEVGMGVAFLLAGIAYVKPLIEEIMNTDKFAGEMGQVALTLLCFRLVVIFAFLIVLGVLAIYDAKWGELPVALLILANVFGAGILILGMASEYVLNTSYDYMGKLWSTGLGALILAGVCFAIYKISRERLMGAGDWVLALAIALALGDWWLSLWVMFLANLMGDAIALPTLLNSRKSVIHFGPFLVIAYIVVFVLGNSLPVLITVDFL